MTFKLMPASPDTCQECAVKHEPNVAHNQQSLFWHYQFYSKRGRWPTWKDAIAHCAPDVKKAWEEELRAMGAWSEPASEAPDVCPTEDGQIGTVTTIPIQHPKRKGRKKK